MEEDRNSMEEDRNERQCDIVQYIIHNVINNVIQTAYNYIPVLEDATVAEQNLPLSQNETEKNIINHNKKQSESTNEELKIEPSTSDADLSQELFSQRESDFVDNCSGTEAEENEKLKGHLLQALSLNLVQHDSLLEITKKKHGSVHFTSPVATIHEYSEDTVTSECDTQSLTDSDSESCVECLTQTKPTNCSEEITEETTVVESNQENERNSSSVLRSDPAGNENVEIDIQIMTAGGDCTNTCLSMEHESSDQNLVLTHLAAVVQGHASDESSKEVEQNMSFLEKDHSEIIVNEAAFRQNCETVSQNSNLKMEGFSECKHTSQEGGTACRENYKNRSFQVVDNDRDANIHALTLEEQSKLHDCFNGVPEDFRKHLNEEEFYINNIGILIRPSVQELDSKREKSESEAEAYDWKREINNVGVDVPEPKKPKLEHKEDKTVEFTHREKPFVFTKNTLKRPPSIDLVDTECIIFKQAKLVNSCEDQSRNSGDFEIVNSGKDQSRNNGDFKIVNSCKDQSKDSDTFGVQENISYLSRETVATAAEDLSSGTPKRNTPRTLKSIAADQLELAEDVTIYKSLRNQIRTVTEACESRSSHSNKQRIELSENLDKCKENCTDCKPDCISSNNTIEQYTQEYEVIEGNVVGKLNVSLEVQHDLQNNVNQISQTENLQYIQTSKSDESFISLEENNFESSENATPVLVPLEQSKSLPENNLEHCTDDHEVVYFEDTSRSMEKRYQNENFTGDSLKEQCLGSPVFIPASQVMSHNSQDSGSTGFVYDPLKSDVYLSSQESTQCSSQQDKTSQNVDMEIDSDSRKNVLVEIAEDGICKEELDDNTALVDTVPNFEIDDKQRLGDFTAEQEQTDQVCLDEYIDTAIEEALSDDHTVPGTRTVSVDPDQHLTLEDSTLYATTNVDKRWKLYSCDADIYDDNGKPVCSPVNNPGTDQIGMALPSGCFDWKKTASARVATESPLPSEDLVIKILPLQTCGKPLRLGLSKKQPVHSLHNLKNLKN